MSKLSFRARALDASKPLPVFRCEDLPDLHEYASINRAVPQMPTGMEKEEESVCYRPPAERGRVALEAFSRRRAPLCCLRKLVQNGRRVRRSGHTTALDEYSAAGARSAAGAVVGPRRCRILSAIRVVPDGFAPICARRHKGVT